MIIAVIPAKGSSSRLPNKNMQHINNKPMIFYSIQVAKECDLIDKIYVSTDSNEIADYSSSCGVEVIRRGEELGGETPIVEVYRHAISILNDESIEYIIGIQPDHPDRKADLSGAIKYVLDKKCDELISVDGSGAVNGSLKIMSAEALKNNRIGAVGTIMDDCTNVHYLEDLKKAESNLIKEK